MFNDYPEARLAGAVSMSPVQESKRDQLVREKKSLQSRIEDIDKVLGLFDKYPETEDLINLLRRV